MISASSERATTARAVAFVAEHREPAEALGVLRAELINDPEAFAADLRRGLTSLADPDHLVGQRRIAPGIGALHGVRWPLLAAVQGGFRVSTKGIRPTPLLFLVDRLFREPELESRWFAFGLLERTLAIEAERTWQLLRRAAREALAKLDPSVADALRRCLAGIRKRTGAPATSRAAQTSARFGATGVTRP
jgi:hypothetical protein